MMVEIKNIIKKYNNINAVNNVSLEVNQGDLLALLGPSGCGKTTLLRIIAGLTKPDSGRILINGKDITNLPPQKRNTALVFQSYALFPHLNVAENIAYGLKNKDLSKKVINQKLQQIADIIELKGLLNRQIFELSGGQQQRVALARALVLEPDILLFDEPLSNLDEKLRVNMRQEIKRIQSELNITSIYVTHDQKEALAIANKIAVMNSGVIEQLGSSNEIYHHPVNSFVSNFIGESNLVKPQIVKRSKNSCIIKVLDLQVEINTASDEFLCLIRPEEIYPTQHNGIEVKVKWVENMGNIVRYTLSVGNDILIMDRLNKLSNKKYEIGEKLTVLFEKQAVKIVEV